MFSIVIPLYNKGPHIKRTLDSVLSQTFDRWEAVVVDDGSSDDGPEIVKSYADSRIRLIHQANQGPSEARNRGIEESKFSYIAFLDADDEWLPDYLDSRKRLIEQFPQAGIYAGAYQFDDGKRQWEPRYHLIPPGKTDLMLPNYFLSAKPGSLPVWTSATVIPKKVLEEIGGFPRNVPRGQDLECWSRVALKYPVAFTRQVGAIYHKDAVNRHDKRKRLLDRKLGLETALDEGTVPTELVLGVKVYIQRIYVRRVTALVKRGDKAEAEILFKKIGAPLVWDVRWRLWVFKIRNRLVPFGLVDVWRKLRKR